MEGTQGTGLSVYHSLYYPKTTSRDTTAAGCISEVGLSPRLVTEVVVVFRTFPIRVAGSQAGPLFDEITWERLQSESRSPEPLHEYTSVTHNLRRLGRFDWEAARRSVNLNRPTRLALNFVDYISFENRSARKWDELDTNAKAFARALEGFGVPIGYVGTGPQLSHNILPEPQALRGALLASSPQAHRSLHDTPAALTVKSI